MFLSFLIWFTPEKSKGKNKDMMLNCSINEWECEIWSSLSLCTKKIHHQSNSISSVFDNNNKFKIHWLIRLDSNHPYSFYNNFKFFLPFPLLRYTRIAKVSTWLACNRSIQWIYTKHEKERNSCCLGIIILKYKHRKNLLLNLAIENRICKNWIQKFFSLKVGCWWFWWWESCFFPIVFVSFDSTN